MNKLLQEWVSKSDEDFRSAQVLLADESPLVAPALFHLQQCVEKLLKVLLIQNGVDFERRHDLSYLHRLCQESDFVEDEDLFLELNPFAVEFRYPGDLPVFSIKEARSLMSRVSRFRDVIRPMILGP